MGWVVGRAVRRFVDRLRNNITERGECWFVDENVEDIPNSVIRQTPDDLDADDGAWFERERNWKCQCPHRGVPELVVDQARELGREVVVFFNNAGRVGR